MKNFLFFLTLTLTFFTSCTNDDESDNKRNHALLDMMQNIMNMKNSYLKQI